MQSCCESRRTVPRRARMTLVRAMSRDRELLCKIQRSKIKKSIYAICKISRVDLSNPLDHISPRPPSFNLPLPLLPRLYHHHHSYIFTYTSPPTVHQQRAYIPKLVLCHPGPKSIAPSASEIILFNSVEAKTNNKQVKAAMSTHSTPTKSSSEGSSPNITPLHDPSHQAKVMPQAKPLGHANRESNPKPHYRPQCPG